MKPFHLKLSIILGIKHSISPEILEFKQTTYLMGILKNIITGNFPNFLWNNFDCFSSVSFYSTKIKKCNTSIFSFILLFINPHIVMRCNSNRKKNIHSADGKHLKLEESRNF